MFAVAVWHWVGFLLGQCVRDQVRTIAATGLRTASIELRAIAMLAHCASTRSALHLAACTQRDNSTMGLARRRREPAERVIGAIDPKIRCCMALWSSTHMHSSMGRMS